MGEIRKEEVPVKIIPKLVPSFDQELNLNLNEGDTLIVTIDRDLWTIDEAIEIYKLFCHMFPENNVMGLFNGVQLSLIHEQNETTAPTE